MHAFIGLLWLCIVLFVLPNLLQNKRQNQEEEVVEDRRTACRQQSYKLHSDPDGRSDRSEDKDHRVGNNSVYLNVDYEFRLAAGRGSFFVLQKLHSTSPLFIFPSLHQSLRFRKRSSDFFVASSCGCSRVTEQHYESPGPCDDILCDSTALETVSV